MVFRFVSPLKKENAPIHCKDHGGGSQAMASSNWLLAKEELDIEARTLLGQQENILRRFL